MTLRELLKQINEAAEGTFLDVDREVEREDLARINAAVYEALSAAARDIDASRGSE